MSRTSANSFHFGHVIDPATGSRTGEDLTYDARDLTTHAVIVGMTGSGKTGLGIVMIEEALRHGVPALILDPKGDMANLLLTFPDLEAADFAPWVNEGDARRKGLSVEAFARETADQWRDGLAGSGMSGDDIRALRAAAPMTLYTPGSLAGVPLNIVGSLRAPRIDWDAQLETVRDEIEGFASSLLGLVGIAADPISSREHILLANLVEHAWKQGQDLDIATLIGQIQKPPLRKLGVFEMDSFFPTKDRTALAMRLNGLVASPSFQAWLAGPELDVARMLHTDDGRPRAAVVYLAHLSDEERQFVVTLLLSKAVTWFRGLSGTTDLRALLYMDEVFGYAPPTANPPSKKPILTILKQARAFGVGMILATQNPVDLDYKAMSNAGTWMVGRLQTERDKARVLEGLASARGGVDVKSLDAAVTGLGKRQFLLQSAHRDQPVIFASRWAMSYLRGPLTREQVAELTRDDPARSDTVGTPPLRDSHGGTVGSAATPVGAAAAVSVGHHPDESPVAPKLATGVAERYLDPGAPWGRDIGADPRGTRLEPALAARVYMRFDDTPAGVDHSEEWEAIFFPLEADFDPRAGTTVDYDARDFSSEPPAGATYALAGAPLESAAYFQGVERALRDALYQDRTVQIHRNVELRLYGRVGESREAFEHRCDEAAQSAADRETAALRTRVEARLARARDKLEKAEQRLDQVQVDLDSRKRSDLMTGAGDLLSALLTGRSRTRGLIRTVSKASSRRSVTERTGQRLTTAEEQVEAYAQDIEEIEAELSQALSEIDDRWSRVATTIDTLEVGLEKSDISVSEVAVVWVPVAARS